MPFKLTHLATADPEITALIHSEQQRQEDHLELIASENYTSLGVLEAQGSILTNKYAEGYPHKRYYGGCEYVDGVESIAIERAKALFQAEYANVQPHSGSQANSAAYMALMRPGDTLLGMSLAHGGHLTHGGTMNFSGQLYKAVHYGLCPKTEQIDYEEVARLAQQHRPQVIVAGFSAYSQIVDWQYFRSIADEVGAYLMVDMAHIAGLVAANSYPSPIPYADVVTSTTHKTLRGPRGGLILARKEFEKRLNSAVFPGTQGGPLMHVIAAKAVAFKEAGEPEFRDYQRQVIKNAQAMAQVLHNRGYRIVSGGTQNHLFLVDLQEHPWSGKEAEDQLGKAHITLNKNMIPGDKRAPHLTSGLRIGTPAVTTRGFKESEVREVASWIADVLDRPEDPQQIEIIRQKVVVLTQRFPVYH